MCRKCRNSSTWVPQSREMETVVEKNDDSETRPAARSSKNENANISLGVTRKDTIRSEHT